MSFQPEPVKLTLSRCLPNYTTNCTWRQIGDVCNLDEQYHGQSTLCKGSKVQRLLAKPFLLYKKIIYIYIYRVMSNADAWLKSVKTKQLGVFKDYEPEMKWLSSSEAKQRVAAAKALAISEFKKRFPRVDISRFQEEVELDANRKATATVLFTASDGLQTDPLLKDRKYWSQPLKDALGMHQDGGFPAQLTLLIENKPQPVPAFSFYENITQSIADVLNKEIKIYVTPTDYFTTKFRQIFTNTKISFRSAKYTKKLLGGPHMSFWPQQLNFAFWCATTGCGVSREILFPSGSSLNLTPQMRSFYLFHVYYTKRKILYEMGGIQSKGALPDDPVFNQKDNPYDVAPTAVLRIHK